MPEPPPEPLLPFLLSPAFMQLETPAARITSNKTDRKILRRRRKASGSKSNPQKTGSARQKGSGSSRDEAAVVEIVTTTLPELPLLSVSPPEGGLKVQSASVGSVPQT